MKIAKIIGKITLTDEQRVELTKMGVSDIAIDNPVNRNDTQEIISRIGDAEAIIINISTPVTKDVISACRNLKFIQTWSTGMDNIDLVAARDANIVVKNVPDFSVEAIAEKTIAMLIFISSQMLEANADVNRGYWNYTKFQGVELKGKTLGIIGKGKIGGRVSELAAVFGMHVEYATSKTTRESIRKICSISDFITLHCPLNDSTYHILGQKEFESMKRGVYLVNYSRGGVVDEVALLEALQTGIVKYATLDVFEQEPPASDHPLLSHPNVFVTPHIGWNTRESLARLTEQCISNLKEYINLDCENPAAVLHNPYAEGRVLSPYSA